MYQINPNAFATICGALFCASALFAIILIVSVVSLRIFRRLVGIAPVRHPHIQFGIDEDVRERMARLRGRASTLTAMEEEDNVAAQR